MVRKTRVGIQAVAYPSCVALGKSIKSSELQCLLSVLWSEYKEILYRIVGI